MIKSYQKSFQKQSDVKNMSKRGTTVTDMQVKKERIQHKEEREVRSRKELSSIPDLKNEATGIKVEIERNWKHVDYEATPER